MSEPSTSTPARDAAGEAATDGRPALVRRGRWLARLTIGWNAVEGIAGIAAGVAAGSIVLVGFGVDSYLEVLAGAVVLWRLAKERHGEEVSAAAEHRAVRLIALTFLALAAGIAAESARKLVVGDHPDESTFGIALAVVSLLVMPLLARAKRRVGERMGSRALQADATETTLCVWLSGVLLAGLALNAALGWWWADPLAALVVAFVALREGLDHWRSPAVDLCC